MNKFKKDDTVVIISGSERKKEGKISQVLPKTRQLLVEDINVKTHYVKKTEEAEGGLIKKISAFPWAKAKVVCPSCKSPTRVKLQILKDGKKVRQCQKCDAAIDKA